MTVKQIPFHDEFKIDRQIVPTGSDLIVFLINDPAAAAARRPYQFLECNTRGILSKCILKCEIHPFSLPEVILPDYSDEDTDTEQFQKTLALQWQSPRYQGVVWANESLTDDTKWAKGDFFSILNNSGVPYVNYNILNMLTTDIFEGLGRQSRLAISFQDVGWGVPKATDILTLKGTWAQQGNMIVDDPELVIQGGTYQQVTQMGTETIRTVGTIVTQLIAPRANRKSGTIKNLSATATINYSFFSNMNPLEGAINPSTTITLPAGNVGGVWVQASAASTSVSATEIYNVVNA